MSTHAKRLAFPLFSAVLIALMVLTAATSGDAARPGSTEAQPAAAGVTPAAAAPWPNVRYNSANTGFSPTEGALGPPLYPNHTLQLTDAASGYLRGVLIDATGYFIHDATSIWGYDKATHERRWVFEPEPGTLQFLRDTPLLWNGQLYALRVLIDDITLQTDLMRIDPLTGSATVVWTIDAAETEITLTDDGIVARWSEIQFPFNAYLARLDLNTGDYGWIKAISLDIPKARLLSDGTRIVHVDGETIEVYGSQGGALLWRFAYDGFISTVTLDALITGERLVLAEAHRLVALDMAPGAIERVLWTASVGPDDQCWADETRLASDGEYVAVAQACDNVVAVVRLSDGGEVWRAEIGHFFGMLGPVIANGTLYVPNLPSSLNLLWAFDLASGALEDTYPTQGPVFALAAGDGLLYAGGLASNQPALFILEQMPADLALAAEPPAICAAMPGATVSFTLLVTNHGPGGADPAEVRVSTNTTPVSLASSAGTCSLPDRTCTLPLASGATAVITYTATLNAPGRQYVTATVAGDLPDKNPGNNRAETAVQVDPLPADPFDLTVAAIEVTQGIQDLENSVPLVAGKRTAARVYVETGGQAIRGVEVELHGSRGGVPLPGSPLRGPAACADLPAGGWDRAGLATTANFELPPEWTAGDVVLEAVVNPQRTLAETDFENNSGETSVSFNTMAPICVSTYRVRTSDGSTDNLYPWIDALIPGNSSNVLSRALAFLPTADIWVYPRSRILEEWEFFGFGPYEFDDDDMDDGKVLLNLWLIDQTSDDPDECDDLGARTHYLGMVHEDTLGSFNGVATVGMDQLIVKVRTGPFAGAPVYNLPFGGRTLAHEFAHNYDRRHVDCGNPDDPDPNYPYDPCHFGPNDPTAFYGFDLGGHATWQVIAPTDAGDLLSYASGRWPSDYTWNAIARQLYCANRELCVWPPPAGVRAEAAPEVLLVSGLLIDETVTLDPIYRLPVEQLPAAKQPGPRAVAPASTLYAVTLWDAGDTLLHTEPFTPTHVEDGDGMTYLFGVVVPFAEATVRIAITYDDTTLAEQTASATPPTVTLLTPTGGETIGDELVIEWLGSDADGDELAATVQYSHDGGGTWQTLAANLPTESLTVPTDWLAGSAGQALVRVWVTDGFHTTADQSAAGFTVPRKAPHVSINRPAPDQVFVQGEHVIAGGTAYDVEDGYLRGSALAWRLEGGAPVGEGEGLTLVGLAPGTYTLVLRAEDGDGASAEATVTFRVVPRGGPPSELVRVFVPLTLR